MQQITLDIGTPLVPTLDNFYPGPNAEVHSYIREWLAAVSTASVASTVGVYIAGPAGSGKSHLVVAVAGALIGKGQLAGVLRPDSPAGLPFEPAWSAIILEDVQAYDSALQHTAFNWYVNAQSEHRAVFATGTVMPRALTVREDLRTRLGGGQVFHMKALSESEVRMVLRSSAQQRGLVLGEEVLDFVMHRFSRDLGSLMPLLAALDHYALQTQRAITIPFVKTMLERL